MIEHHKSINLHDNTFSPISNVYFQTENFAATTACASDKFNAQKELETALHVDDINSRLLIRNIQINSDAA